MEQFDIINPEMPPDAIGDKFCRLDINMTVNSQRVNLEVQVANKGDYPERSMYHWRMNIHPRSRLEKIIERYSHG